MKMELIGVLYDGTATQQKTETFSVRKFVLKVEEQGPTQTYEQYIELQLMNNNCSLLDNFEKGDMVRVSFNIRGNKWEKDGVTHYITNLNAWRMERVQQQQPSTGGWGQPAQAQPAQQQPSTGGWGQPAQAQPAQQQPSTGGWGQPAQAQPAQQQPSTEGWGQPAQAQPAQQQPSTGGWGQPAQQQPAQQQQPSTGGWGQPAQQQPAQQQQPDSGDELPF